jgi:hypothetical protein
MVVAEERARAERGTFVVVVMVIVGARVKVVVGAKVVAV